LVQTRGGFKTIVERLSESFSAGKHDSERGATLFPAGFETSSS